MTYTLLYLQGVFYKKCEIFCKTIYALKKHCKSLNSVMESSVCINVQSFRIDWLACSIQRKEKCRTKADKIVIQH